MFSDRLAIATRCYEQKHFARSAEICREILQQQPENTEVLRLLSIVADCLGDIDTVILCYQKLIGLLPDRLDLSCKLGSTMRVSRRFAEAIAIYQKVIARKPDCYQAHNNLGNVFRDLEEREKAIACFQNALAINPNYTDAYLNLGAVLIEQTKLDEAIAVLRKLLALNPESVDAYRNLGAALAYQDKLEEAIACYQKAIVLQPNYAEAHASLGSVLGQQCKPEEEISCYQKAITLQPDLAPARFSLATALLRIGDYKRGFVEYEWRWQIQKVSSPFPSHLLWDGSDLQERTILIWTEQGFGDTLQFMRYVPFVAELGGKIVVQCSLAVIRLMSDMDGISHLVTLDSTPPEFDVHIPLLSLPRIFGTTLETIPNRVPYLFASQQSVVCGYQSLKKEEGQRTEERTFKVGIVWASSYRESSPEYRQAYRQKSCPVDLFVELLAFPNVSLYSLQVGRNAGDIAKFGSKLRLQALSDRIGDFADTATAIARLDLVISVDTAVAHLAGAMGKPVWVLLPFSPDWRWLLGRDDSPWYPTMRLFRQPQAGDWAGVFDRVTQALREYLSCNWCTGV